MINDSKKIAIMQPYFFPYIGYFQLIYAADLFVVYDDGHMIRSGYIHQNSILGAKADQRVPIKLNIASKRKMNFPQIREMKLSDNVQTFKGIKRAITMRYQKAPYFSKVMPLLEQCLDYEEENLVKFLWHELRLICEYIGITTPLVRSSDIPKPGIEHVQEKVWCLCNHFDIHHYINPIGGKEFYHKDFWAEHGVKLSFLHRNEDLSYMQYHKPFVRDLSIIDVMMFNSPAQIRELLGQYRLE